MKNLPYALLLLYILFTSITLHCMRNQPIEPWQDINYKTIEQNLDNKYKSYLTNRLIQYKNVNFTVNDRKEIQTMRLTITGNNNPFILADYLDSIVDDKQNNFLHIAIEKRDLEVLRWLIDDVKHLPYTQNGNGKEPIDLCIDQLMPLAPDNNKQTAHEILDILTAGYDKAQLNSEHRIKFLKKMVLLQLEHTKNNTNFILKDSLFTRLIHNPTNTQKRIALPKIYQEVTDTTKNTFTHILVQRCMTDQLYEFVQKEYITFAENNDHKNPLEIAEKLLQEFTQHTDPDQAIATSSKEFYKKRCCFFILLNYLKKKNNETDFAQCCEKHSF